ncbi:MAG: hypothetical protein LBJ21_04940 [Acidobacteriota bacterium]|jgi:uncharacterized membrane protein YgcG|nr:hypothetical protein [Acidobacteriota bacterium]
MKTTVSFLLKKSGLFLLMPLLFLLPGMSVAQADTKAAADAAILPWLGIWTAVDESTVPGTTSLEIRPAADGKGLNITTKDAEQPVGENIIPDGIPRPVESSACTGTSTYQWEKQTGIILGKSEMVCQGEAYNIFTLKMMTSADLMADILFVKTPGQNRLAVRRFAFERTLPPDGENFSARDSLVLRTALAAPWDTDKIISLSKTVETVVLEAALLEKNLQVQLDSKSLRKMKSSGTPDSIIDILVALSAPDKFRIEKNDRIAVEAASPAAQNNETYTYVYRMEPPYYGYYYPWHYYWSYYSPFWWGYPIYTYPVVVGGGSGGSGGGGTTGGGSSGYSEGRLSSGSGYVQITPRDTGHRAVPRGSAATGGGGGYTAPSGGYVPPSGGGSYSGYSAGAAGASSGGGSSSGGASASPSGYSGGSGGGTAAPRQ